MTWQLDWSHATADIPRQGLFVERSASAEECALLAAALEVLACERLDVRYEIEPLPQGRYVARGQLTAVLEQSCVVTLSAVPTCVEDSFEVPFWPPEQLAVSASEARERSVLAPDDPEPIENYRLAIGRVIFELITAGLDHYPRAAGAEFEWAESRPGTGEPGQDGPFAGLANWKAKTE
jgi:hypothetical protein